MVQYLTSVIRRKLGNPLEIHDHTLTQLGHNVWFIQTYIYGATLESGNLKEIMNMGKYVFINSDSYPEGKFDVSH